MAADNIGLTLTDIFILKPDSSGFSKAMLSASSLNPKFIQLVANKFDLQFVSPDQEFSGNTCFAQNDSLLPGYKQFFTKADVLNIVFKQHNKKRVKADEMVHISSHDFNQLQSESFMNENDVSLYIPDQKKKLRKIMLEERDSMPRSERNALSENICDQIWSLIRERNVKVLHSFLTMGSEVNVLPLLQKALDANITVVAPKTLKKRKMQNLILSDMQKMEAGVFNTYHPADADEYTGQYDLIIVAGLAFQNNGYRLGYGGGYYDTFLAKHKNACKVGVCYPFQILEKVPLEEHDIKVDQVIY
ncbi:MAG: 5-formyltetrahydrofolate cyclo-ligase [Bacteroidetes bacterium]|nr:5-formyltetrahydrofolate cyclo-ligase [Bacteroidota bacterium]